MHVLDVYSHEILVLQIDLQYFNNKNNYENVLDIFCSLLV